MFSILYVSVSLDSLDYKWHNIFIYDVVLTFIAEYIICQNVELKWTQAYSFLKSHLHILATSKKTINSEGFNLLSIQQLIKIYKILIKIDLLTNKNYCLHETEKFIILTKHVHLLSMFW